MHTGADIGGNDREVLMVATRRNDEKDCSNDFSPLEDHQALEELLGMEDVRAVRTCYNTHVAQTSQRCT
jgi:hypothetical protein